VLWADSQEALRGRFESGFRRRPVGLTKYRHGFCWSVFEELIFF
jgi:hypothetical protein